MEEALSETAAAAFSQTTDMAERHRLYGDVRASLAPFVSYLIGSYLRNFPARVDDIRQSVDIAIWRALLSFDPSKGKFSTWAAYGIRQAAKKEATTKLAPQSVVLQSTLEAADSKLDNFAFTVARQEEAARDSKEQIALLMQKLQLGELERDILVRRFGLGGTMPESYVTIASRHGMNERDIAVREELVLRRLRRLAATTRAEA